MIFILVETYFRACSGYSTLTGLCTSSATDALRWVKGAISSSTFNPDRAGTLLFFFRVACKRHPFLFILKFTTINASAVQN